MLLVLAQIPMTSNSERSGPFSHGREQHWLLLNTYIPLERDHEQPSVYLHANFFSYSARHQQECLSSRLPPPSASCHIKAKRPPSSPAQT